MPPYDGWYSGPEAIGQLIEVHCPANKAGDQVMVPVGANGQPAYALYMRRPDGQYEAFQLQVLTVENGKVSHVGCFFDLDLFARFGLPMMLDR
jgi:RNA polymerase sigma-70 factor (ECF subfamily)